MGRKSLADPVKAGQGHSSCEILPQLYLGPESSFPPISRWLTRSPPIHTHGLTAWIHGGEVDRVHLGARVDIWAPHAQCFVSHPV